MAGKKNSISRRTFLAAVPAAIAGNMLACASISPLSSANTRGQGQSLSPDEALASLLAGNNRYLSNNMHEHDFHVDREALAESQHPIAAVISCSDSRVVPQFAFDQGPGKLFEVRVAGNIANDQGIASIEYAVKYLQTPLIFILGHSSCGAVNAAINAVNNNADFPGKIPGLVSSIASAVRFAEVMPGDLSTNTINENVRLTAAKVANSSPIIHSKVQAGAVKVVGGVYELSTGRVSLLS